MVEAIFGRLGLLILTSKNATETEEFFLFFLICRSILGSTSKNRKFPSYGGTDEG